MSRRQLRKLQKGKDTPEVALEEEDYEIDDRPAKPRQSLFASFAALQEHEDDEGENEYEGEENNEADHQQSPQPAQLPRSTDEPVATPPKKKKKKSKKNKGRRADQEVAEVENGAQQDSRQEQAPNDTPLKQKTKSKAKSKGKGKQKVPEDDGLDEIDRAIKELNLKAGSSHQSHFDTSSSATAAAVAALDDPICRLLKINSYYLKVGNEMKSLFGKDTVAAAEAEEQTTRAAPRHQGQPTQGTLEDYLKALPNQGLKGISINKNYLIQGKKTWPMSTTSGLSMRTIYHQDSAPEFAFAHDNSYIGLETQFFVRSNTYNPNLMIEFLHSHPYHISSLVIVSKIAKHQGDHALAADLGERALFTFGRTMLSSFKHTLEQGKARLDFRRYENRQFWLAGHQYLVSLMRRGTHRTALEWSKLLLQLDTADPYAIGQLIHVIAIKAKEYEWFLDLCDTGVLRSHRGYPEQTAALAKLRLGDEKGAVQTVRAGMQDLPWLYSELFKSLGMDVPKAIWGCTTPPGADELYTALYIHQTRDLWNYPKAMDVLFEAAHGFDKPENVPKGGEVDLGVARMVYLDENRDLMALIPVHILHSEPNFEFDPLPPRMEDNIFSSAVHRRYFEGSYGPNEEQELGVSPPEVGGGESSRGALGAVLDFMRTQLAAFAGGGRVGEAVANDVDDDDVIEELVRLANGAPDTGDVEGLFFGHPHNVDDEEDSDDNEDLDDDEEIPGLVVPDADISGSGEQQMAGDESRRSLRASVEDAQESDDDDELPPLVDSHSGDR